MTPRDRFDSLAAIGPRPSTTCMFKRTKSRRSRACDECRATIATGETYWHDGYYSMYGSGARYCEPCGDARIVAEAAWQALFDAARAELGEGRGKPDADEVSK